MAIDQRSGDRSRSRTIGTRLVIGLLALLAIAALISLLDTNRGSVRMLDMLRERVHGTVAPQVSVKALLPSPPSPPPHSPSDGSWVDSRPVTWEPRKPGRSA